MFLRNNADVTHCEKTLFYFQNKAVYRAEDSPRDICLKLLLPDKGKKLKFLILVFFLTSRENQELYSAQSLGCRRSGADPGFF